MAHVSVDLDTKLPPETVLGALTDFSEKRIELWPNIDRSYYKVHGLGDTWAEVTEGSKGVWERTRYDWSRPGIVSIQVLDSNAFRAGSHWLYSAAPLKEGGSHVHLEFQRDPRTARGYLLSALLSVLGKKIFGDFLEETVRRLEQRAHPGAAPPPVTPAPPRAAPAPGAAARAAPARRPPAPG
jgi:hypothetical protein